MTATARAGGPKKLQLVVTEAQKLELLQVVKAHKSRNLVFRARIILKCADGMSNTAVAAVARTTPFTVRFLRNRFIQSGGVGALLVEPPAGAPGTIWDGKVVEMGR